MFLELQGPELEPVVKSIPEIIKEASQSQRGIFALLIIVLFSLALYFFRSASIKWRAIIFFALFAGVVAYGWEINRVASKPVAMHYTGRVLDQVTTQPIHEALLTVTLGSKRIPPYRSDSDGNFSFWLARKNPTEDASVRVEHENYREYDRTVSSESDTRLGDIQLMPISLVTEANSQSSLTGSAIHPTVLPTEPQPSASAASDRSASDETKKIAASRAPAIDRASSSGSAKSDSSVRPPRIVENSSGPKLSGKGNDWSPWYEMRVGVAPEGYTIQKTEFWLTGDRSCGAWAECKEVTKSDNQVVWTFRLQGHDEWGAPPQAYSEGHMRVSYISK